MRTPLGRTILIAALALLLAPAIAATQGHGRRDGGWTHSDDRRDRGDPRGDGRDEAWRADRRPRCRDAGTGGTIIGAIAGGLLGNSIPGGGDALPGRALDRDC